MDHQEVIRNLKFEYYAVLAALRQDDELNGTNLAAHMKDFYEFLQDHGYTRQQLSALGISRKNALGDV